MPNRVLTGIRLLWRKRFGVLPIRSSLGLLSAWFASPLGQSLVSKEREVIDEQLHDLFGYHLMQLSVAGELDLTGASRISHQFALYPRIVASERLSAVSDFNHLPLPQNSIDVVLLHHVLDFSQNPHQVLRETAGVLISRGHLIIIGFNPWSLFGLWRLLARFFSSAPHWRHQSLRLGRVLDWLAVLDFEPVAVHQGFYRPPVERQNAVKYLQWMDRWGKRLCLPGGGFYVIVARKDSVAMIPLKPEWQGYASLRGWGVTKILGRASRQTRKQPHQKI